MFTGKADFCVDMHGSSSGKHLEEGLGGLESEEALKFDCCRFRVDSQRHDAVLCCCRDLHRGAAGTVAQKGRRRVNALFRNLEFAVDAGHRRQIEAVVEGAVADVRIDVDAQVFGDVSRKRNVKVHENVGGTAALALGEGGGKNVVEHLSLIEIAQHPA